MCRADLGEVNPQHGRYRLQANVSSGSEPDNVDDIETIAVSAPWVVGTSAHGYFIADSHDSAGRPEVFQTEADWMTARRSDGISDNLVLENPDVIAGRIPPQVLRPYDYALMHGRLGLSDGNWGDMVIFGTLGLIFIRGLFAGSKAYLVSEAIIIGLLVDVVAEMVLLGGGGPAFAGLFFLPAIFSIVAKAWPDSW